MTHILTNISPIDGRYHSQTNELSGIFSEYGLIKYRVFVEIKYFMMLNKLLKFNIHDKLLLNIYNDFDVNEAEKIKSIEQQTNHDVKAVEYYIKNKLGGDYREYVHFGLTSQDVNSVSYILQIKDFIKTIYQPCINILLSNVKSLADRYSNLATLTKTHGQPASPSILGKEFLVFYERLENQYQLNTITYSTKFGGAVGNLNAHYVAYPDVDWVSVMNDFIHGLGLKRNTYTTQIDHYDNYAKIFDMIRRCNVILIDLCQDMWLYISNNYFTLKINKNEIGSSTMPHKVNPINFENAEGNLLLSNSLLNFMSNKLPISRLQRDLTDSTVLRNMGVAFSHTVIGIKSLITGLSKVKANEKVIHDDLERNWAVVSEGIQTILRAEHVENPYELLKDFTRTHGELNKKTFDDFINNLDVSDSIKTRLLNISPFNYTGKW
jgi:adenylosuccinate lyase